MNNTLRMAVVAGVATSAALLSSGAALAADAEGEANAQNNTFAGQLGLVNAVVPVGNVLAGNAGAIDEIDVDVLSD